ncbi:hypothetical protein [Psittacicella gerlachiana]|uniref:Uncharacterized protein n=1 Tax=Psittacicella gerlachiana TaxID=2028574 RepID=A0A3A1Y5E6_9GAMM|nr:hypothetical protein [Psittacicella gerlachiana]RIY31397.1 hypothetical protein CKF59_07670 [Psittacicella gerlachiana]
MEEKLDQFADQIASYIKIYFFKFVEYFQLTWLSFLFLIFSFLVVMFTTCALKSTVEFFEKRYIEKTKDYRLINYPLRYRIYNLFIYYFISEAFVSMIINFVKYRKVYVIHNYIFTFIENIPVIIISFIIVKGIFVYIKKKLQKKGLK